MRSSYQKLQLPSNYAQQLLDRQIDVRLSRQPVQANLCKLLELYSAGFEYYESIGSYKFRYFELRMKEVFVQQQQENLKNQQFLRQAYLSQEKEKGNQLINSDEARLVDKKCRQQQRVQHFKELTDKTSVKSTNEQIRNLLLSGDYKAIEVYTKITYQLEVQEKMLQQKLQMRHRRSVKNNSRKERLKMNSTQTSLLSQSSRKGEYLSEIKQNIFDKLIGESEDEEIEIKRVLEGETDERFYYLKEESCE